MADPDGSSSHAAPKLKLLQDALREIGLEPTIAIQVKARKVAKELNACQVISRQHYVTDEQFAQITEERRQLIGDPSLSAAEVWSRNLSRRSREREQRQRLTRYVAVPDEPDEPEEDTHQNRPKLKLLERALQDAGIQITKSYVRQMRDAAKQLNACYIIGRKCYVTDEQLAQLLEAYRWQRGSGHHVVHFSWYGKLRREPQLRGVRFTESPSERVMRRFAEMDKQDREKRRKERERNKR
jgi:histidinol phosphatase-like enzyme